MKKYLFLQVKHLEIKLESKVISDLKKINEI